MPIIICEFCGKPFNNAGVTLCRECSKEIEDTYIKARRYIYKNPKTSDFISIVNDTEVSEKALSYLINKGRIILANQAGSGQKCRACGKETESGTLCESCRAKLLKEKLTAQMHKKEPEKPAETDTSRRKELPMFKSNRDLKE